MLSGGAILLGGSAAWQAEYRETVDLLTRSRVAVYPIDARGLLPSTTLQASNNGEAYVGPQFAGAGEVGTKFQ